MTGHTILVVEDSEDVRLLMKMILETKGHRVVEAADGVGAVERSLEERPHLILMDLSMPVMDGWEATRRLRLLEETRRVPIVGLSAHCNGAPRELAIKAGCDDCISKPVDEGLLDEILTMFLAVH